MPRLRATAALLMIPVIRSLLAAPPAPPEELSMPARLRAEMTIVNASGDPRDEAAKKAVGDLLGMTTTDPGKPMVQFPATSAMVSIVIQRWTLPDERDTLHEAIASGGVEAVVKAMKKMPTLGEVRINAGRVPIRAAATWMTEHTQRVRLVFTSRLVTTNPDPFSGTGRALDVLDLSLPHGERYGSGSLVTATKVEFVESGLISPVDTAVDSATQPLNQVERQPADSR